MAYPHSAPRDDEQLLTVSDVGRLIDRSAAAVRRAAELGYLPVAGRTSGAGVRLFRRADVEAYRERQPERRHGGR